MRAAIQFLEAIVLQTAYIVFLAGAALAVLLGILLLVDSARVLRWNTFLSRWVSTRDAMRPLDEPHDIKRFVYRNHRILGVLVVAGAIYTLDVLTFGFQTGALARIFRGLANQSLLGMLLDTLRLFLITANLLAVVAGLALAFRPSLLKGVEAWADRSYSTRSDARMDEMRFQPDQWVSAHPKLAGVLAAAGGGFILLAFGLQRFG
ncbi:MAG: hypothetical protein M3544_05670 [Pseudomonadota bacterium]|nr:hypothetical protein [Pseudomonadota bacterium]